mgnify:CR=1 FL=1|tara:strand:+ start:49 stop:738 length:690 start_codon:yes stop_codon:yes gene_type:complete
MALIIPALKYAALGVSLLRKKRFLKRGLVIGKSVFKEAGHTFKRIGERGKQVYRGKVTDTNPADIVYQTTKTGKQKIVKGKPVVDKAGTAKRVAMSAKSDRNTLLGGTAYALFPSGSDASTVVKVSDKKRISDLETQVKELKQKKVVINPATTVDSQANVNNQNVEQGMNSQVQPVDLGLDSTARADIRSEDYFVGRSPINESYRRLRQRSLRPQDVRGLERSRSMLRS